MEYQLIDGKATAAAIKQEIAQEVEAIVVGGGKRPHPVSYTHLTLPTTHTV